MYLLNRFRRLQNIKLEDTLNSSTGAERVSEHVSDAHLRIGMICPMFLRKVVSANSIEDSILKKIMQPDCALVMFLGLPDRAENRLRSGMPQSFFYNNFRRCTSGGKKVSALNNVSITYAVFPEYGQWRKMSMKDRDSTFVGDFLGISMDILSRSRHLQEGTQHEEESPGFSIVPKKIKVVRASSV